LPLVHPCPDGPDIAPDTIHFDAPGATAAVAVASAMAVTSEFRTSARSTPMTRLATNLPDPDPDPRDVSPAVASWNGKTGTVAESSRKLPHTAKQG